MKRSRVHSDKVLVFSQFAKLLAVVRQAIDARQWKYEYLDGRTDKRYEHLRRLKRRRVHVVPHPSPGESLISSLTADDLRQLLS